MFLLTYLTLRYQYCVSVICSPIALISIADTTFSKEGALFSSERVANSCKTFRDSIGVKADNSSCILSTLSDSKTDSKTFCIWMVSAYGDNANEVVVNNNPILIKMDIIFFSLPYIGITLLYARARSTILLIYILLH